MADLQISAVIPVHNRVGLLRAALASVLSQRYGVDEVVVVDDGSTEDIGGAVLRMDGRVRVVAHERNRGAPAARNTGVAAARGRWIAFLDSDDSWTPDKLSRQVPLLIDGATSSVTGFVHRRGSTDERVCPEAAGVDLDRMLRGCHVAPGTTWMVTKERFESLGGFDESFERLEDWDLLLRDCTEGPMQVVTAPCAIVNAHAGPGRAAVERSLAQLSDRWMPRLQDARHIRLLRGGLLMESAAAAHRDGDRVRTVARTAMAAALDPWQASETIRRLRRRAQPAQGSRTP